MFRKSVLVATALVLAACGEAPTALPVDDVQPDFSMEKLDLLDAMTAERPGPNLPEGLLYSHSAPVTYEGTLINGAQSGSVGFQSIGESADWDYWSFCAVAGASIGIDVHRTTSAMDPAASVWQNTTTNSSGLSAFSGTSGPLVFLASADDNNGIPHDVGGSFADPKITTVAPVTGLYTLTVFDFLGAGPADANGEVPYEVHASGLGARGKKPPPAQWHMNSV